MFQFKYILRCAKQKHCASIISSKLWRVFVCYFVSLALHFQPCSLPCYYLHSTGKSEAFKIAATVIKKNKLKIDK